MVDSLRHEVMKSKTGEGFIHETFMQYFSDVEKLEGIVQNKRYTLFNKMKGVK